MSQRFFGNQDDEAQTTEREIDLTKYEKRWQDGKYVYRYRKQQRHSEHIPGRWNIMKRKP